MNLAEFNLFRIPLYGGRVLFCTDRATWDKAYRALGNARGYPHLKRMDGLSQMYTLPNGRRIFLIGWFDNRHCTLVHETAHTAFQVLRHAGVKISAANDEAYAYLIDAIFDECVKADKRIKLRA